MRAGRLNRRVRIEQRSTTATSPTGQRANTWTTFWEGWAEVEEVLPSRSERLAEVFRIAERPARVRTQYVDGITSAMRVLYLDRGNRVMHILAPPVEIGHKEGIELLVSDATTQGAAQ